LILLLKFIQLTTTLNALHCAFKFSFTDYAELVLTENKQLSNLTKNKNVIYSFFNENLLNVYLLQQCVLYYIFAVFDDVLKPSVYYAPAPNRWGH